MPLALTQLPSPALSLCELTYLEREEIDFELALSQHNAYREALTEAGYEVAVIPAQAEHPDGVFVEDTAIVLDEIAVLCRPGAPSRQGEPRLIAPLLEQHRNVVPIEAPATIEGGDVLEVGKTLFVGRTARTNQAGIDALTTLLAPFGYRVVGVPIQGALHFKSACTAPRADTILLNPDWVDPAVFEGYRIIEVHPDEPFAANTLPVGDQVFVHTAYPKTNALLAEAGISIRPIDISEFTKAEAALTCLSLLLGGAA